MNITIRQDIYLNIYCYQGLFDWYMCKTKEKHFWKRVFYIESLVFQDICWNKSRPKGHEGPSI